MKKIIISLLVSFQLMSCAHVLDLEPETATTFTNYFKGEKDAVALLYEILGKAQATMEYQHPQEIIGLKIDKINPVGSIEYVWEWSPEYMFGWDNPPQWFLHYQLIYSCNLLLDNAYRFENIEAERLEYYKQQACFFKAYAYFDLTRRFGDVPIIPNSTTTDKYGREPKLKVLEEAILNAKIALNLPKFEDLKGEGGNKVYSKEYGCKGTVTALLAHIYAWRAYLTDSKEDWTTAEGYCSQIILGEVGNYQLANDPMEVCENVMHRGSTESIFESEYFIQDDKFFMHDPYPVMSCMIGYPVVSGQLPSDLTVFEVSKHTMAMLYDTVADLRYKAYFATVEDSPRAYLKKWNHPVYEFDVYWQENRYKVQDVNRIIWRLADLMLLRAECRVRLGRADATDDLNRIRERAYGNRMHDYTSAEGDLRHVIFRERERELLYEGHRFYDIMRNGYWKTELPPVFQAMSQEEFDKGAQYYPVPETAFYLNDLMIQNEYWLSKK